MNNTKDYQYKVYRNDNYLGLLQVESEFYFVQDINSPGSQLSISVPINIDVARLPVEAILDEDGDPILDENDDPILEERKPDVFGNSNDNILLRNGNQVDVYEISSYYPNGKKMFSGIINRIEGVFGSENTDEVAVAIVYSHGFELDNHLIQDGIA